MIKSIYIYIYTYNIRFRVTEYTSLSRCARVNMFPLVHINCAISRAVMCFTAEACAPPPVEVPPKEAMRLSRAFHFALPRPKATARRPLARGLCMDARPPCVCRRKAVPASKYGRTPSPTQRHPHRRRRHSPQACYKSWTCVRLFPSNRAGQRIHEDVCTR